MIFDKEVVDEAGGKQRAEASASSASCRRRSCSGTRATSPARSTTQDIVDAAQRHVPELRAPGADVLLALCHSGIEGGEREGGEENAALHLAKVPGIDVIFTGHLHKVFPGKDFDGHPRRRRREGHAARRAGRHGRLLGQPCRHHRPRPRARPTTAGRSVALPHARPARSTSARTATSSPRRGKRRALSRPPSRRTTRHARLCAPARWARPGTRSIRSSRWSPTTPRCRSWRRRRSGTSRSSPRPIQLRKGLPVLSAAAPFKAGGRGGPDYYTDVHGRPHRDQGRGRHLPLPQHRPGGEDQRAPRCANGWSVRPACSTASTRRISTEQALINPAFPAFNFDVIDGVTYQIDVTQPSRYDEDGKVRRRTRTASSTCASTASRSTTRRNSSSPPTTTAPAAAATSPARTARRS